MVRIGNESFTKQPFYACLILLNGSRPIVSEFDHKGPCDRDPRIGRAGVDLQRALEKALRLLKPLRGGLAVHQRRTTHDEITRVRMGNALLVDPPSHIAH